MKYFFIAICHELLPLEWGGAMKFASIFSTKIIESGLLALLFWLAIGIMIHIWIPHGQDAEYNIAHIENKPLMTRLVHLGYIFAGFTVYHLLGWTGITALQSLSTVSILSFTIGGWAIYNIGKHLYGKLLGWSLSLLSWPLPLLIQQSQGQEYQPFAMSMLVLAWYFWIKYRSLIFTSIAWAVSVLANPSHAFLFASFTAFSLLENEPIKSSIKKSIWLWLLSATLVIVVWGPFYKELLYGSWAVVPTMSKTGLFDTNKLFRSSAYLGYILFTNLYILIFAIPFKKIYKQIRSIYENKPINYFNSRIWLLFIALFLNIVFILVTVGGGKYGRAWSPVLHWLVIILFMGTFKLLADTQKGKITKRWLLVGFVQILIVFFVYAIPFKNKAYDRYDDYQMIAQKYPDIPVATTGFLNILAYEFLENKLHEVNLDYKDQTKDLICKIESGQIDFFILSYGIDFYDRALLKRLLPMYLLKKARINAATADDMLKEKGFKVNIEPLKDVKGGQMYICKKD
jgi:hypothetical protein